MGRGNAMTDQLNEAARLRSEIPDPTRKSMWGDFHLYRRVWNDDKADRIALSYGLTVAHVTAERTWWLMNGMPQRPEVLAPQGAQAEQRRRARVEAQVEPAPQPDPGPMEVPATPDPGKGSSGQGQVTPFRQRYNWPSDVDLMARLEQLGEEHGAVRRLADELQIPYSSVSKRILRIREERMVTDSAATAPTEPQPAPARTEPPSTVVTEESHSSATAEACIDQAESDLAPTTDQVPAEVAPAVSQLEPALDPAPTPEEVHSMVQPTTAPEPLISSAAPIVAEPQNDQVLNMIRAMTIVHDENRFTGAELQTIIARAEMFYGAQVLVAFSGKGLSLSCGAVL